MDKKELKFYEAPAVETVELEVEGHLLIGSKDATLPSGEEEQYD